MLANNDNHIAYTSPTTPISDINFYLLDGKGVSISESAIASYQQQYPELNVRAELVKCSQKYNSGERRNLDGLRRYVSSWLSFAEKDRVKNKGNGFSDMLTHDDHMTDKEFLEWLRGRNGNLV